MQVRKTPLQHPCPPPQRRQSSGFTMIELSLALVILLVGLMAMSSSTLRMHGLRRQNRERNMAQNTLRSIAEQIHSLSAISVEGEGDTPWCELMTAAISSGGSIGTTFAIPELNAPEGVATIGTIVVITDETATDDDIGHVLGMPRDLDGDGLTDNADVSFTARIMPVVLTATWRGASGVNTLSHAFYIMGY